MMRPRLPLGRALVAALGVWLAAPAAISAQPRPTRPDAIRHYAIQGARIVTVSGRTIDNGTVVVRDGVITAVGRNLEVPAGAWVIDGEGKTVYPGLIDAMTTLGHGTAPVARPRFFGGGGDVDESKHSWGPEDRPGTTSWQSAAEDIDAADERFELWRNAGFTTVMSTLGTGLVTGQAAIFDLNAFDHPREMVVATPVGMRLNLFDGSHTGYPGSLMGSFAYFKQLYLDAQHYDAVWNAYDANPRGKSRPEWDVALEPIRRQLSEGWPLLFPAQNRVEIGRALNTSAVMGVKPIVYGVQGAWDAGDLLAGAGVSALVNLDWPKPAKDGDPEAEPALSQLRLWDRAATTPSELAKAGVRFAFYSGAMKDASGMIEAAGEAVERGLSEEDAIRALTLSAAEIFGVDDRLGSIEEGKIANLVVTSGGLFDEDTRVETVFVDGGKFDVPEETASGRGGRGGARTADEAEDEADSDEDATPIPMAADKGAYREDAVTLITGATILTASHGTIENGDILIRNGKISEVGTGLSAPRGARVVDATGKYVTPGIIDAHSHMAAAAINEGSVNVSAMVGIRDVINPYDVGLYRALAGGVTSINILHGSANPIGGQNAVIKLRWGSDAADLLIAGAHPGIKFALGENTKRDRNPDRYPATRMGVQDVIRQAFLDATDYEKEWKTYDDGGRKGVAPRRDLKLEALMEALNGDRWVHSHSYRADEILQLIRLADEFGFTIRTFQHVLEGYKVADEIAAHGAGASTFSDWWAYKVEAYDAIPYNAALMTERGVLVSINSDSGEEVRHLNQEAAKSMKWGGLDEESALRLVTLNPAKQLGLDDHQGSIDEGKDADLVIYDGYPLGMFAKPIQTYVDGKLYFDIDMDRERQAAVEAEKAALMERYGADKAGGRAVTDRIAAPGRPNLEVIR
jgi:imidazolonepropionase-like amidohydrolase